MRRKWLSVLVLVLTVGGCGPFGGRTFEFEFPARGQHAIDALPVVVEDEVGIVVAIGPGPDGAGDGVTAVAGRPDELVVSWLGGLCDKRTLLTLEAVQGGYTITERTDRADSCLLAGIQRSVTFAFAAPVRAQSVELIPADS